MSILNYNRNKRVTKSFHNIDAMVQAEINRYTNQRVQVLLDSNWEQAKIILSQLEVAIAEASRAGQLSAANKYKKLIRRNIANGGVGLNFEPLADKTVKLKSKRGQDPNRLFYATGTYYNSITVITKGKTIKVGIKPWTMHPTSKLTVSQIATILEYGSAARGIPARPLWKKTWQQFGGPRRVRQIMGWHIATRLRALGFK